MTDYESRIVRRDVWPQLRLQSPRATGLYLMLNNVKKVEAPGSFVARTQSAWKVRNARTRKGTRIMRPR